MSAYRTAILSYHPMPYHVAFYRAVHEDSRVAATVLFLDRYGVDGTFDPEFSTKVAWDQNLLEGFDYKFLKNFSFDRTRPMVMRINPGLFPEIIFGGYDAVLVTGYDTPSSHFAIWAAKLSGKKVILRAEADLTNPSTPLRRRLKAFLLGRILKRCDALLYSCRRNRDYFLHYGAAEEKLFPVLSSVDMEGFRSFREANPDLRARMRAEMGIPDDGVVFLFCGRHIERKRPQDLLHAFARVSRAVPSSWVVSVGDGPLREAMMAEAENRGLRRALYPGFKNLSEIPAYYMMADVFVATSSYDPTPKALNEAMTFGLPGIVSKGVGTADDLIVHNQNGMVFETGDVAALAGAMERLAADTAQRQNMGQAARTSVESWSPQANAAGLVAALDYCLGSPS
ncbi:MAG: glycosyltransferase family 4 protein [Alphaproteobacteria bacterium]|nr:glycosyltransferase family 4 protein [Alphaproteobacteria bacterium]